MRLRRFCFILAFLSLTHTVLAHVDKAVFKEYKLAKKYYAAADYETAKAILAPLIHVGDKNDITPYALFYYALSAYYNSEPALAESTLTTIAKEYPYWEQRGDIWYWLAQLRFEAEDYAAGLDLLTKITEKMLATPSKQMKVYFLQQIGDIFLLQSLYKQHPKDRDVAQVLFDKMVRQPLISRDLNLLNALARDFNFKLEAYYPILETASLKKDSYNVGVFFPFFVDEVDYEEENSNAFVIALYQGIQAAVVALADQGIKINLYAYDTKKDPAVTAALLAQDEVKGMDLIIGPLYASTIPLVADFARAHRINFINPLSENTDVVGDNPFAFLFKPSLETQAKKAAEFTLQNCDDTSRIGIVYGTSKVDALQAHTYQQCMERSTGKEVALVLAVAPEEAQRVFNTLGETPDEDDEGQEEQIQPVDLDGLTHIYVASKNELIVANLLSAVEILKHPPRIIGYEAWLHHSSFTFDKLKQHRLSLIAPDHIAYTKVGVRKFRNDFYNRFAQYPTGYACMGYDMMLFFGHMLAKYGVYFQKHWQEENYQGAIFEGVAYGTHHDNQYVPIVQFQKNRFAICNPEMLENK